MSRAAQAACLSGPAPPIEAIEQQYFAPLRDLEARHNCFALLPLDLAKRGSLRSVGPAAQPTAVPILKTCGNSGHGSLRQVHPAGLPPLLNLPGLTGPARRISRHAGTPSRVVPRESPLGRRMDSSAICPGQSISRTVMKLCNHGNNKPKTRHFEHKTRTALPAANESLLKLKNRQHFSHVTLLFSSFRSHGKETKKGPYPFEGERHGPNEGLVLIGGISFL